MHNKKIRSLYRDEVSLGFLRVETDLLADLVFKGEKTATALAYDL